MTEKELEGAKKLIENKDVKKGSYSFIGDSNITYADIKILLDYIKQLEQEYQKQKEVIDKAKKIHNEFASKNSLLVFENNNLIDFMNNLISVLKEVE